MKKWLLLFSICFLFNAGNCLLAQYKITFIIEPVTTDDSTRKIFVAGNFNNWNPGDSNFQTLREADQQIIKLQLPGGKYEYKFTRGNWNTVESDAKGKGIQNRFINLINDTIIKVNIEGWNDHFNPPSDKIERKHTASKNVHIMDSAFFIPQLNRYRKIWIYLPEGYIKGKKYPVLYMHDGQNLFDEATSFSREWGVDEYLDSIIAAGNKGVIVVGIENGLAKRMSEYNPWAFEKFEGEGTEYVNFIVKTLKPYIDNHYHTFKNKKNTFIAGSSMGGLISLYSILKYPGVFGGAGVFSPAFWTAPQMDSLVHAKSKKVDSKIFFYAGGKESETMVTDMLRIKNIFEIKSPSELTFIVDPEARHNEAAWRKYFPQFFESIIQK